MNTNNQNNNSNSSMSSEKMKQQRQQQQQQQLLRQRRTRILQDQAKEYHEQQQIRNVVLKANQSNNKQIWKIYAVIMLALIVTLISAIQYTRPQLIQKLLGRKSSVSKNNNDPTTQFQPYYIATLYPPNVILDRDLPRFFGTYSIATNENEFAIQAVQDIQKSRLALKKGTGKLKVWLKAWDDYTIQQLLDRNICGSDFTVIYNHLSALSENNIERKNDLIMWCILTTRLADGFFLESIEIIDNGRFSPILLAKKRGMIVKSQRSNSRYVHSFYIHPRNLNYESTLAILPSKVLNYLLDDAQQSLILNDDQKEIPPTIQEYRLMLQSHIYDMVMSNKNIDNYLELTEICFSADKVQEEGPQPPPIGAIAKTKSCNDDYDGSDVEDDNECCYFVLPEPEAKRYMIKKDNNDNDED